jgi:TetR/AcrR family transcriptional regulator, transcriptional repressor for nem operon
MPRSKNFIPETVLDKAVSVFAKYGYHGVSMAMLVDELELNRASIYNTFGDKRSLYISSLNQYISNWPIPQANGHDIRIEDLLEFTKKRIYQNNEVRGCYLLKAARPGSSRLYQRILPVA